MVVQALIRGINLLVIECNIGGIYTVRKGGGGGVWGDKSSNNGEEGGSQNVRK